MDKVRLFESKLEKPQMPAFKAGDTVRVHVRIKEGEKERTQVFEGMTIKVRRGGPNASFTVRKISEGVGVERVFPMFSPVVQKVEVKSHGIVRRSRLYYLRNISGKSARIKTKNVGGKTSKSKSADEPAAKTAE